MVARMGTGGRIPVQHMLVHTTGQGMEWLDQAMAAATRLMAGTGPQVLTQAMEARRAGMEARMAMGVWEVSMEGLEWLAWETQ